MIKTLLQRIRHDVTYVNLVSNTKVKTKLKDTITENLLIETVKSTDISNRCKIKHYEIFILSYIH